MRLTLAVLADPHLPDHASSAQDAFLDWALETLARVRPDVTILAGDLTATGTLPAARRLRARLDQSGLPFLITPGNSDRRTPGQWEQVRAALETETALEIKGVRVLLADTSQGDLCAAERSRLERTARDAAGGQVVLITHVPPDRLDADSRAWLDGWAHTVRPSLILCAHRHVDLEYDTAGTPTWLVRGLDPDKAIGGPPALTLAHFSGGAWRREDVPSPLGLPATWTPAERAEFRDLLGISCMEAPLEGLEFARQQEVRCVELRYTLDRTALASLRRGVEDWRAGGGTVLSWHMPNVVWDEQAGAVKDPDQWRDAVAAGLDLGVDALTVHVPRIPVRLMRPGSGAWQVLGDMLHEALRPAAQAGVRIGVENLRIKPGAPADDSRGFGCVPQECLAWGDELRGRLGQEAVGQLLDVSHARNNGGFSNEFPLSTWYALLGPRLAGFHLHQVMLDEGGVLRNHQPVRSLHGPLISFSSLLWAWHTGQVNRVPMFLEIRDPAGLPESVKTFRRELGRGACPPRS